MIVKVVLFWQAVRLERRVGRGRGADVEEADAPIRPDVRGAGGGGSAAGRATVQSNPCYNDHAYNDTWGYSYIFCCTDSKNLYGVYQTL